MSRIGRMPIDIPNGAVYRWAEILESWSANATLCLPPLYILHSSLLYGAPLRGVQQPSTSTELFCIILLCRLCLSLSQRLNTKALPQR